MNAFKHARQTFNVLSRANGLYKRYVSSSITTLPEQIQTSHSAHVTEPDPLKKSSPKNSFKLPLGTADYSSKKVGTKEWLFDIIENYFKKNSIGALDTCTVERKDLLTEKYGEDSKLIFDIKRHDQEDVLSLRYDLTVPFALYLARKDLTHFKRYQIGKVYRLDEPQVERGRYREFYQCDFDVVGRSHLEGDVECLKVLIEILSSVQIGNFIVKLNHRTILNGIFDICGVPPHLFHSICSSVDKLGKFSWAKVKEEMVSEKGLPTDVADKLETYFLRADNTNLFEVLLHDPQLRSHPSASEGLDHIQLVLDKCKKLGISDKVTFDMSLARGLDYYTGVIFEAVLTDVLTNKEGEAITVGSIGGGGRYDSLVGMFSDKNKEVPCVGVSIGIERLFTILENKFPEGKCLCSTEVYVSSPQGKFTDQRNALTEALRSVGFKADTSIKRNTKFRLELVHCEEKGIPWGVIVGEKELASRIVKLRNIKTREEIDVPRSELVETLRSKLNLSGKVSSDSSSSPPNSSSPSQTTINNNISEHPDIRQMRLVQHILKNATHNFQKHGAEGLETPLFEMKNILIDKYSPSKIQHLADQGDELLSLRPDLIVPFARHLALNKTSSLKAYQIGKVFQREGVLKELLQADFHLSGKYASKFCEVQCINVVSDILSSLNIDHFTFKVNHCNLLNGLLKEAGVTLEQQPLVRHSLQKLHKLSWEDIKKELTARNITEEVVENIKVYLIHNNDVDRLSKDVKLSGNRLVQEGLEFLEKFKQHCFKINIKNKLTFDPSLSKCPKLYTGVMFDTFIQNNNSLESVAEGGRYDNLVSSYLGNKYQVPIVGVSLAVYKLLSILESKKESS